jgi:uncharacterized membrane protein YfcA
LQDGQVFSPDMIGWVAAALVGGLVGGHVGARRMKEPQLRALLGVVLVLASVKLWMT